MISNGVQLAEVKEEHPASDLNPIVRQSSDITKSIVNRTKKDWRLDYEVFHWIFILFFTLVAVIDRYTLNLWPLWVDSPGPTIPGNFSVTVFAVIAWISSRMLLVSSSYIFLFQCRTFFNWLVERKFINKYLKIGDIHHTNIKLHYYVGLYFIGIPVVLHVWAIPFAAIFPQNEVYLYDSWMRPSNPDGTSISFYADNLLSLGINDVYRIVSTSVTFFILIPYSIFACTRDRNWSFAQYLHLFGALIYTIDLMRMTSHPHCWVFNTPFILMWIIDRLYGIYVYRRCVGTIVHKVKLDSDYTILYLRVAEHLHLAHSIGDVYYLNKLDFGWDKAHPFTVFQNHNKALKYLKHEEDHLEQAWKGHKFSIKKQRNYISKEDRSATQLIMSRADTACIEQEINLIDIALQDKERKDEEQNGNNAGENNSAQNDMDVYDWNVGVIFQVTQDHPDCYYRKTWTNEITQTDSRYFPGLRCWGPMRSEYRILLKQPKQNKYPSTPLVLIGTGAGCGYLLDFYNYINSNTNHIMLSEKVYIYFSSRSISMFQWFTDITCHKHIDNLYVNAHLTSHDKILYLKKESSMNKDKTRDSEIGRLSFQEILNVCSSDSKVFFCGSPSVQTVVNKLCKQRNLEFHQGHSFH